MFYVESRYYDNGEVNAVIWTQEEADMCGLDITPFKDLSGCDRYIEEFDTLEEAEAEVEEALEA